MSNWPYASAEQLETVSQLVQGVPPREIPTYDHLTYDEYLERHLIPNTPFLLSASSTASWRAATSFRTPDTNPASSSSSSKPNLSALRRYAHQVVPIANTRQQQYSEFVRSERPLGEILDQWERGESEGMYVKDWHLMAEIEAEGRGVEEVYEVPECLRDDWLNPPYAPRPSLRGSSQASTSTSADVSSGTSSTTNDPPTSASTSTSTSTDDFRFTYLGPPLTYTPLHRDVYGSYSWSANVVGRKVWWLFAPSTECVDERGELAFDVRGLEGEARAIRILQQEGEVIFVPSGWHHQVVNLDFCISINHNFFSSPTLARIYAALSANQSVVEASIADVRDMIVQRLGLRDGAWEREWVDEVQGLLERDAGWGWKGFWRSVLDNVQTPAPAHLSPPRSLRNTWIKQVIELYKGRREWVLLDDVREVVQTVEGLVGA